MEPQIATYYDAEERTWYGPRRKPLYSEDITLGEVIYDTLLKNSQKIIQINDGTGEKLTCYELLRNADALSRNLLRMGLRPGDVVGLYVNNWTHVVTIMLASFLCGTPVNALYPGFDKESCSLIFNVTKPKIIFCEMENVTIAQNMLHDLKLKSPIYVVNGELVGVPHVRELLTTEEKEENLRFPCQTLKGDDTAVILCSSGTTGIPKGVLCSHRALLNQKIFLTLTNNSVLFTFSTLYWASGLWTLLASLLNGSMRIITSQAYTPEYFLQLIAKYKITHIIAGGTQMAEMCMSESLTPQGIQTHLQFIDTLIIGGAKVPLILQEKFNFIMNNNSKRPGLTVAYGMSELSGMVSLNSGGQLMERLEGSEGKLVANCVVRILSKEGKRLGPLEHGEICILSPYKWKGYYNNPEATRNAQRDNWLYSGDIGYFDEKGYLYVCGRDNDIFKSKNFQIYPPLIEDVVLRLPGVAETCVFAIPDIVASNLTGCVVVRSKNSEGANLTAKEVDQHVKTTMGSMYHLSGGCYFLDAIPKTASGKNQRHKVLELVMLMREGK